ncbi:hemerythrin domain-containing protein [Undibacterium sp. TJN19]|uniref:hemerythrin domain-containing protein n=1 Tax=Undibacterium sp. TJN19 TaxID=3413055 RepID=UPI003BF056DA
MNARHDDAINILERDHEELKALFRAYDNLGDRTADNKKMITDAICQVLIQHVQMEEKTFYPAVTEIIKDKNLMDEVEIEIATVRDLIWQIQCMNPDDDLYDPVVKVLEEEITLHVSEVEDEMFPKLRRSKIDLLALGEEMRARRELLH